MILVVVGPTGVGKTKMSVALAKKYDAIVLDSYFYIFNRMGTDVYLMNDIWSRMRNLTGYTLQTWYIPEKAAAKKRSGDKK